MWSRLVSVYLCLHLLLPPQVWAMPDDDGAAKPTSKIPSFDSKASKKKKEQAKEPPAVTPDKVPATTPDQVSTGSGSEPATGPTKAATPAGTHSVGAKPQTLLSSRAEILNEVDLSFWALTHYLKSNMPWALKFRPMDFFGFFQPYLQCKEGPAKLDPKDLDYFLKRADELQKKIASHLQKNKHLLGKISVFEYASRKRSNLRTIKGEGDTYCQWGLWQPNSHGSEEWQTPERFKAEENFYNLNPYFAPILTEMVEMDESLPFTTSDYRTLLAAVWTFRTYVNLIAKNLGQTRMVAKATPQPNRSAPKSEELGVSLPEFVLEKEIGEVLASEEVAIRDQIITVQNASTNADATQISEKLPRFVPCSKKEELCKTPPQGDLAQSTLYCFCDGKPEKNGIISEDLLVQMFKVNADGSENIGARLEALRLYSLAAHQFEHGMLKAKLPAEFSQLLQVPESADDRHDSANAESYKMHKEISKITNRMIWIQRLAQALGKLTGEYERGERPVPIPPLASGVFTEADQYVSDFLNTYLMEVQKQRPTQSEKDAVGEISKLVSAQAGKAQQNGIFGNTSARSTTFFDTIAGSTNSAAGEVTVAEILAPLMTAKFVAIQADLPETLDFQTEKEAKEVFSNFLKRDVLISLFQVLLRKYALEFIEPFSDYARGQQKKDGPSLSLVELKMTDAEQTWDTKFAQRWFNLLNGKEFAVEINAMATAITDALFSQPDISKSVDTEALAMENLEEQSRQMAPLAAKAVFADQTIRMMGNLNLKKNEFVRNMLPTIPGVNVLTGNNFSYELAACVPESVRTGVPAIWLMDDGHGHGGIYPKKGDPFRLNAKDPSDWSAILRGADRIADRQVDKLAKILAEKYHLTDEKVQKYTSLVIRRLDPDNRDKEQVPKVRNLKTMARLVVNNFKRKMRGEPVDNQLLSAVTLQPKMLALRNWLNGSESEEVYRQNSIALSEATYDRVLRPALDKMPNPATEGWNRYFDGILNEIPARELFFSRDNKRREADRAQLISLHAEFRDRTRVYEEALTGMDQTQVEIAQKKIFEPGKNKKPIFVEFCLDKGNECLAWFKRMSQWFDDKEIETLWRARLIAQTEKQLIDTFLNEFGKGGIVYEGQLALEKAADLADAEQEQKEKERKEKEKKEKEDKEKQLKDRQAKAQKNAGAPAAGAASTDAAQTTPPATNPPTNPASPPTVGTPSATPPAAVAAPAAGPSAPAQAAAPSGEGKKPEVVAADPAKPAVTQSPASPATPPNPTPAAKGPDGKLLPAVVATANGPLSSTTPPAAPAPAAVPGSVIPDPSNPAKPPEKEPAKEKTIQRKQADLAKEIKLKLLQQGWYGPADFEKADLRQVDIARLPLEEYLQEISKAAHENENLRLKPEELVEKLRPMLRERAKNPSLYEHWKFRIRHQRDLVEAAIESRDKEKLEKILPTVSILLREEYGAFRREWIAYINEWEKKPFIDRLTKTLLPSFKDFKQQLVEFTFEFESRDKDPFERINEIQIQRRALLTQTEAAAEEWGGLDETKKRSIKAQQMALEHQLEIERDRIANRALFERILQKYLPDVPAAQAAAKQLGVANQSDVWAHFDKKFKESPVGSMTLDAVVADLSELRNEQAPLPVTGQDAIPFLEEALILCRISTSGIAHKSFEKMYSETILADLGVVKQQQDLEAQLAFAEKKAEEITQEKESKEAGVRKAIERLTRLAGLKRKLGSLSYESIKAVVRESLAKNSLPSSFNGAEIFNIDYSLFPTAGEFCAYVETNGEKLQKEIKKEILEVLPRAKLKSAEESNEPPAGSISRLLAHQYWQYVDLISERFRHPLKPFGPIADVDEDNKVRIAWFEHAPTSVAYLDKKKTEKAGETTDDKKDEKKDDKTGDKKATNEKAAADDKSKKSETPLPSETAGGKGALVAGTASKKATTIKEKEAEAAKAKAEQEAANQKRLDAQKKAAEAGKEQSDRQITYALVEFVTLPSFSEAALVKLIGKDEVPADFLSKITSDTKAERIEAINLLSPAEKKELFGKVRLAFADYLQTLPSKLAPPPKPQPEANAQPAAAAPPAGQATSNGPTNVTVPASQPGTTNQPAAQAVPAGGNQPAATPAAAPVTPDPSKKPGDMSARGLLNRWWSAWTASALVAFQVPPTTGQTPPGTMPAAGTQTPAAAPQAGTPPVAGAQPPTANQVGTTPAAGPQGPPVAQPGTAPAGDALLTTSAAPQGPGTGAEEAGTQAGKRVEKTLPEGDVGDLFRINVAKTLTYSEWFEQLEEMLTLWDKIRPSFDDISNQAGADRGKFDRVPIGFTLLAKEIFQNFIIYTDYRFESRRFYFSRSTPVIPSLEAFSVLNIDEMSQTIDKIHMIVNAEKARATAEKIRERKEFEKQQKAFGLAVTKKKGDADIAPFRMKGDGNFIELPPPAKAVVGELQRPDLEASIQGQRVATLDTPLSRMISFYAKHFAPALERLDYNDWIDHCEQAASENRNPYVRLGEGFSYAWYPKGEEGIQAQQFVTWVEDISRDTVSQTALQERFDPVTRVKLLKSGKLTVSNRERLWDKFGTFEAFLASPEYQQTLKSFKKSDQNARVIPLPKTFPYAKARLVTYMDPGYALPISDEGGMLSDANMAYYFGDLVGLMGMNLFDLDEWEDMFMVHGAEPEAASDWGGIAQAAKQLIVGIDAQQVLRTYLAVPKVLVSGFGGSEHAFRPVPWDLTILEGDMAAKEKAWRSTLHANKTYVLSRGNQDDADHRALSYALAATIRQAPGERDYQERLGELKKYAADQLKFEVVKDAQGQAKIQHVTVSSELSALPRKVHTDVDHFLGVASTPNHKPGRLSAFGGEVLIDIKSYVKFAKLKGLEASESEAAEVAQVWQALSHFLQTIGQLVVKYPAENGGSYSLVSGACGISQKMLNVFARQKEIDWTAAVDQVNAWSNDCVEDAGYFALKYVQAALGHRLNGKHKIELLLAFPEFYQGKLNTLNVLESYLQRGINLQKGMIRLSTPEAKSMVNIHSKEDYENNKEVVKNTELALLDAQREYIDGFVQNLQWYSKKPVTSETRSLLDALARSKTRAEEREEFIDGLVNKVMLAGLILVFAENPAWVRAAMNNPYAQYGMMGLTAALGGWFWHRAKAEEHEDYVGAPARNAVAAELTQRGITGMMPFTSEGMNEAVDVRAQQIIHTQQDVGRRLWRYFNMGLAIQMVTPFVRAVFRFIPYSLARINRFGIGQATLGLQAKFHAVRYGENLAYLKGLTPEKQMEFIHDRYMTKLIAKMDGQAVTGAEKYVALTNQSMVEYLKMDAQRQIQSLAREMNLQYEPISRTFVPVESGAAVGRTRLGRFSVGTLNRWKRGWNALAGGLEFISPTNNYVLLREKMEKFVEKLRDQHMARLKELVRILEQLESANPFMLMAEDAALNQADDFTILLFGQGPASGRLPPRWWGFTGMFPQTYPGTLMANLFIGGGPFGMGGLQGLVESKNVLPNVLAQYGLIKWKKSLGFGGEQGLFRQLFEYFNNPEKFPEISSLHGPQELEEEILRSFFVEDGMFSHYWENAEGEALTLNDGRLLVIPSSPKPEGRAAVAEQDRPTEGIPLLHRARAAAREAQQLRNMAQLRDTDITSQFLHTLRKEDWNQLRRDLYVVPGSVPRARSRNMARLDFSKPNENLPRRDIRRGTDVGNETDGIADDTDIMAMLAAEEKAAPLSQNESFIEYVVNRVPERMRENVQYLLNRNLTYGSYGRVLKRVRSANFSFNRVRHFPPLEEVEEALEVVRIYTAAVQLGVTYWEFTYAELRAMFTLEMENGTLITDAMLVNALQTFRSENEVNPELLFGFDRAVTVAEIEARAKALLDGLRSLSPRPQSYPEMYVSRWKHRIRQARRTLLRRASGVLPTDNIPSLIYELSPSGQVRVALEGTPSRYHSGFTQNFVEHTVQRASESLRPTVEYILQYRRTAESYRQAARRLRGPSSFQIPPHVVEALDYVALNTQAMEIGLPYQNLSQGEIGNLVRLVRRQGNQSVEISSIAKSNGWSENGIPDNPFYAMTTLELLPVRLEELTTDQVRQRALSFLNAIDGLPKSSSPAYSKVCRVWRDNILKARGTLFEFLENSAELPFFVIGDEHVLGRVPAHLLRGDGVRGYQDSFLLERLLRNAAPEFHPLIRRVYAQKASSIDLGEARSWWLSRRQVSLETRHRIAQVYDFLIAAVRQSEANVIVQIPHRLEPRSLSASAGDPVLLEAQDVGLSPELAKKLMGSPDDIRSFSEAGEILGIDPYRMGRAGIGVQADSLRDQLRKLGNVAEALRTQGLARIDRAEKLLTLNLLDDKNMVEAIAAIKRQHNSAAAHAFVDRLVHDTLGASKTLAEAIKSLEYKRVDIIYAVSRGGMQALNMEILDEYSGVLISQAALHLAEANGLTNVNALREVFIQTTRQITSAYYGLQTEEVLIPYMMTRSEASRWMEGVIHQFPVLSDSYVDIVVDGARISWGPQSIAKFRTKILKAVEEGTVVMTPRYRQYVSEALATLEGVDSPNTVLERMIKGHAQYNVAIPTDYFFRPETQANEAFMRWYTGQDAKMYEAYQALFGEEEALPEAVRQRVLHAIEHADNWERVRFRQGTPPDPDIDGVAGTSRHDLLLKAIYRRQRAIATRSRYEANESTIGDLRRQDEMMRRALRRLGENPSEIAELPEVGMEPLPDLMGEGFEVEGVADAEVPRGGKKRGPLGRLIDRVRGAKRGSQSAPPGETTPSSPIVTRPTEVPVREEVSGRGVEEPPSPEPQLQTDGSSQVPPGNKKPPKPGEQENGGPRKP